VAKRKFYEAFRSLISSKPDDNSVNLTNYKCEKISGEGRSAKQDCSKNPEPVPDVSTKEILAD
jgi:hypothetical protein